MHIVGEGRRGCSVSTGAVAWAARTGIGQVLGCIAAACCMERYQQLQMKKIKLKTT